MRLAAMVLLALTLTGCITPWKGPRADAGLTTADARECTEKGYKATTVGLGPVTDFRAAYYAEDCMKALGYYK